MEKMMTDRNFTDSSETFTERKSESPFGTLNSEGRVKAAIVRLGILDDNGIGIAKDAKFLIDTCTQLF